MRAPDPIGEAAAAIMGLDPEPSVHLAYVDGLDELVRLVRQSVEGLGEDYTREHWIGILSAMPPGKNATMLAGAR